MPPSAEASLDWFALSMGLFGGLALFLFGLDQLSEGLKQAAGDRLKMLLTRLTANRFLGVLTGALVTGVLNSSSVTTVLVVGFVTAGIMSLSQSVAVIMGANIGSTVTAQLLAFNVSAYALLPVAVGFFMSFAGKRGATRYWGTMLMGLGLVFYGMGVMGDTMKPLRSYEPFVQVLATMDRPLYGILAGVLFTALVQSSAATVGLAIAMASEGLLSLDAGIALALGANIGTCATALLASIGKPVEAVRAATVHVMFNVLGVVLWLPFIGVLATLATAISPSSPDLDGTARLAAEVPRQIANANTLFNVLNTLFFIGFTGWFARITTRLVPDRRKEQVAVRPKFLDPSALDVPTVALEQVRQELGHVGERLQTMLHVFGRGAEAGDRNALASLSMHRTDLATLDNAILEFLSRLRERAMTRTDSKTQSDLMTAAVQLSAIGDLIVDELASAAEAVLSKPYLAVKLKHATTSELYQAIHRAVAMVTEAVRRRDTGAAKEVEAMSPQIRRLADEVMARLVEGWNASAPESVEDLRLQTALVDNVRQIFTLTKRIARTVSG